VLSDDIAVACSHARVELSNAWSSTQYIRESHMQLVFSQKQDAVYKCGQMKSKRLKVHHGPVDLYMFHSASGGLAGQSAQRCAV
jgi:hypothetical protein